MKALKKMAKKLVAAGPLPAGHRLTAADVAIKSPGDGLAPYQLDKVLGQMTRRALAQDENIEFGDLQRDA
jgi:N-acetylneuraminate synthase/sialic acid synthase